MGTTEIVIRGAREHNLRAVDVVLPRNRLICFSGVSGSGKSSLAFDTLYAEGQRRYVESLSSGARHFLGQMPKPEVDAITGLSPAISISQKTGGQNPRSTVGTITEIYDFLRVLYARVGEGHCPTCGRQIATQTVDQIVERIAALPHAMRVLVLAPVVRGRRGEFRETLADYHRQGFHRARINGRLSRLDEQVLLERHMRHDIEIVVDRLTIGTDARGRLYEAVETALKIGDGELLVVPEAERPSGTQSEDLSVEWQEMRFSARYSCNPCGLSFDPPTPQLFSFNSPKGMCSACQGLGETNQFDLRLLIPDGSRSVQQGCIALMRPWRELGRTARCRLRGVAEYLEKQHGLPAGYVLETAWEELDPVCRDALLYGTGDAHITFTWRSGPSGKKFGGKFAGLLSEMMEAYRAYQGTALAESFERFMSVQPCAACGGGRLNPQASAVTLTSAAERFRDKPNRSLPQLCALSVSEAREFFERLVLSPLNETIAAELLKEIRGRLGFLADVGLGYLSLDRTAPTLSGGEMQRIRLAGQVGCGLCGVLYVLDEPSIGLHPRDNQRLLATLSRLRDQGNTVVVVEHDEDTMRAADHIVDFGPGAGVRGGRVVASGKLSAVTDQPESVTGQFLIGARAIPVPDRRRPPGKNRLIVRGASHNNLRNIDVEIPLGLFVCVTGVSGSGKSSLVRDILAEALNRDLNGGAGRPGAHRAIEGTKHLDKLIDIDQSPIGRTPRSNPATYIKLFDQIRAIFAELPSAKSRGFKPGRFSFNVAGGRCEACEGHGAKKLDMDFLADIWAPCSVCGGKRFNHETLQVLFKGKSIADVLEMDVQEALELFENIPRIQRMLQTLHDVGLDYMKLGQPSPTLSGGEAQRIKLARELVKRSTGRTLYLLDEPTTGLHFADVELLLKVLHGFVDAGNTVLVVEHNLEVVKTADWIIDLGPEGGFGGGQVVACGTPEEVARCENSHTGRALRGVLEAARHRNIRSNALSSDAIGGLARPDAAFEPEKDGIVVRGAQQHNLKHIDVVIPRNRITVCCGPSGSGKSSLAMDTVYAEGQRRYVESLSAYARQFVGQMPKPAVEFIDGLSPAVALEQKHHGHSPRSTLGTITEIYDYLRIVFARLGQMYCPMCDVPVAAQTSDQITARLLARPEGTLLYLLGPLALSPGDDYSKKFAELRAAGFARVRVDGRIYPLDAAPQLDRRRRHRVEVVVDRVVVRPENAARIADSVETTLNLGEGVLIALESRSDVAEEHWPTEMHSRHCACVQCGRSFEPLNPHHFSFNSPLGWCPHCEGLGVQQGGALHAAIRDPRATLRDGAPTIWPNVKAQLAQRMIQAWCAASGIPADVPFEQLGAVQRRQVLYGSGDRWFEVRADDSPDAFPLRFQYRGIFPTLEAAGRLSPYFRQTAGRATGEIECMVCGGSRLRSEAAAVRFRGRTIDEFTRMPLGRFLDQWRSIKLEEREREIAGEAFAQIASRAQFLVDVGLDYLTPARPAPTLSGGEMQRIRLAAQIGSGLCGVLYVLDEPTVGLHPRDNAKLIDALRKLRDLGNTVLLVEHDRDVIAAADYLLDFGPGAGRNGGQIVATGTPAELMADPRGVTAPYLARRKSIPVPAKRRPVSVSGGSAAGATVKWLKILGAEHHNLRRIDVHIPLGRFVAVTGPSGSGKSSLIDGILYAAAARRLNRASTIPGKHQRIVGWSEIDKVIRVDQEPLGQTPASNAATYTGVFDEIRRLFAELPESRMRGYSVGKFSFNMAGGRCDKCEGNGQLRIEMHFLPDVWIPCDSCGGKRFKSEVLAITYRGKSIADVLEMSCGEALRLFDNIPKIRRILQMLCDVGLDYLPLGQSAATLSGGEAQRVKLAAELARPDTGRTLYLLDEPTTGLHFDDLVKLIEVLQRLVDLGNTVVVVEHNLDLIKSADWVIDLGPEAGEEGGQLVFAGTPEELVAYARRWVSSPKSGRSVAGSGRSVGPALRSYTGEALAPTLDADPRAERAVFDRRQYDARRPGDLDPEEVGRNVPMPWETDGRRWHLVEHLSRSGRPCLWEARALEAVMDRLAAYDDVLAPADWARAHAVEVAALGRPDFWFCRALTGDPWLLRLRFRTARATFNRDELVPRLGLRPLNELDELPLYGTKPRTRVKNLPRIWQEIDLRVFNLAEIDRPGFYRFLDEAVAGFRRVVSAAGGNGRAAPAAIPIEPWTRLGPKWHTSHRGFPLGTVPAWRPELVEQLAAMIGQMVPEASFRWDSKSHVTIALPGRKVPWAILHTKQPDALHLDLEDHSGNESIAQLVALPCEFSIREEDDRTTLRLSLRRSEELHDAGFRRILNEHAEIRRKKAAL